MNAFRRLLRTFVDEGVRSATRKILRYAAYLPRRAIWRKNLYFLHKKFGSASRSELFSYIHKKNIWFSAETKSGCGSTLQYTEAARTHIPIILETYKIESIYDAPCGDFNWMRLLVKDKPITYLGADIVPSIIAENNKKFASKSISFLVKDIVSDLFPNVDLWICRHCFFHFSNQDILSTLERFCESKSKYILTTNFISDNKIDNADIPTGHFRSLDLFAEPFCFPLDVKYRFSDYVEPDPPMEMILLARSQIASVLPKMRERIGDSNPIADQKARD